MKLYFDAQTIIQLAGVVSAASVLIGLIVSIYKMVERDKRQSVKIHAIQEEQTLLCYGILACLKGMREQGCNGPVTEALNKLEKHLNQKAHGWTE